MIGAALFTACQFALAPLRSTTVDIGLLFLTGIFFTIYTANSNTYVQLQTPDYIRGRVLGIYYYAWAGLSPIGALLTGWLCAWGGTALAFYIAGAAGVLMLAAGYAYLKHTVTQPTLDCPGPARNHSRQHRPPQPRPPPPEAASSPFGSRPQEPFPCRIPATGKGLNIPRGLRGL